MHVGQSMLRAGSRSLAGVLCVCLCCCTNLTPPRTTPPPLPLANRIAKPDPRKYETYASMEWGQWKNPRLVIRSHGIEVLTSVAANGPTVTPEAAENLLERTKTSDWPFGLIVMVVTAGVDSGNLDQVKQNTIALLGVLKNYGI